MNSIYNTYRPPGFHTLNAYLFSEDPATLIYFLQQAFYAQEINRTEEDGIIRNCILRIGDSCFMVSQETPPFLGMRTSFYLYTEDVDTLYRRALKHGAESVIEPMEMSYMDYQGGVKDPAGNYWWISKRMVEKPYQD